MPGTLVSQLISFSASLWGTSLPYFLEFSGWAWFFLRCFWSVRCVFLLHFPLFLGQFFHNLLFHLDYRTIVLVVLAT